MTDFDAALERLVADPAFRDELASDPARALAGYRLSPDELDLLRSQVDTGGGDSQRQVETRTSKASLFGLLSPMGGLGGFGDATPTVADTGSGTGGQGGGQVGGSFLTDHTDPPSGPSRSGASFGADEGRSGASFGSEEGRSGASFGSSDPGQGGGEPVRSGASFGTDDGAAQASFGDESAGTEYRPRHGEGAGLGAAVSEAGDFMSDGGVEEAPRGTIYTSAAAQEYTTRVDANGDGRWDEFTATNRADGGVDLSVDRDGDGNAEFVGHDLDRDGLIDEATTDEDGDGTLDTRWVDNDGDGWLDTRQQQPPVYEAQRSELRDPRAQ
jgi:hypothetical protein